jgi:diamine N-acetyltransferase
MAAAHPTKPVLRIGAPRDALSVAALAIQVFLETYATEGMRSDVAREACNESSAVQCEERLADPARLFSLAEREGHLLGFAEVSLVHPRPNAPTPAGQERIRLSVQPALQRKGIGSALLRRAALQAPTLWLTAWAGTQRALHCYRACGDHAVGATSYVLEGNAYENRLLVKQLCRPRAEPSAAPDCLQRPVRRSSSCSIPIADGKDAEEVLGSAAYLNPKGRGDKSLPAKPRVERRC